MKQQAFNTETNKWVKVRQRKETRIMSDAYLDFVSRFKEVTGVEETISDFLTLGHQEGSKNKLVEVSVYTHSTRFTTDDWTLFVTPYNNAGIEIYKIEASKAGSGIGTNLMNTALDIADELNICVNLVPVPFLNRYGVDGINPSKLNEWYMSFGFKKNFQSPYLTYKPNN